MPWNGIGPTSSLASELRSMSLPNPSACRRYVRVKPGGTGPGDSKTSSISSPPRVVTNRSSTAWSGSVTSPNAVYGPT